MDLLISLKNSFEQQLAFIQNSENKYRNKIAELREQFYVVKNSNVADKEKHLDFLNSCITYQESQLQYFMSQTPEQVKNLNQHLYLVTKSIVSILAYRHLSVG
ncbi:hypothetical protein CUU64_01930 [Bacillus sp. V5-8f]|nr:hypothetical protein CUU64_01930 [Bacillus sp. V5-8f]